MIAIWEGVGTVSEKSLESYQDTFIGRLTRVSVDKSKSLQINSTRGIINCTYNPAMERFFSDNVIGSLVRARGTLTLDRKSKTLHINSEKDVERMEYIPIKVFTVRGDPLVLKSPLKFHLLIENDEYILTNEELDVFSVSDNIKDATDEISKILENLWVEYVEADISTLTEDAIELREKLQNMVVKE